MASIVWFVIWGHNAHHTAKVTRVHLGVMLVLTETDRRECYYSRYPILPHDSSCLRAVVHLRACASSWCLSQLQRVSSHANKAHNFGGMQPHTKVCRVFRGCLLIGMNWSRMFGFPLCVLLVPCPQLQLEVSNANWRDKDPFFIFARNDLCPCCCFFCNQQIFIDCSLTALLSCKFANV